MLGKKSRVARICWIILRHCLTHGLELSVGDVFSEVGGINHKPHFWMKVGSSNYAWIRSSRCTRVYRISVCCLIILREGLKVKFPSI